VSLGPAGAAPGGEATKENKDEEPVEDVEPIEQEPVSEPEWELTEVEPEPVFEPEWEMAEVEPEPLPEPEPVVETVKAPALPKPTPTPKPVVKKVEKVQPKPEPTIEKQPPTPTQTAAIPAGAAGKSGAKDDPDAGSGDNTAGGGIAGVEADYYALLQAWLEKHKEYPKRALRRRQEGTVMLRFTIDQKGKVLSYAIEEGSGFRLLDREVEKMIKRASPVPPMPVEMDKAQLELVVPVAFFVR